MPLIASWNIEKNGQSSTDIKQMKVSDFIDRCCRNLEAAVVFLCEVHSARVSDYVKYAQSVYGKSYAVYSLEGGHSNAYVVLTHPNIEVIRIN